MYSGIYGFSYYVARLAQSVEHETLNLRVVGSSPTLGDLFLTSFPQDGQDALYKELYTCCEHGAMAQLVKAPVQ